MSGARILHVGVGNSLLARRFCARGAEVVGTTIAPEEVAHGRAMGITRYDLRLHNKYRGHDGQAWGHFDFIVDNNPSSFACCLDHYMTMLKFYSDVLKPDGQFLVDRVGLGWALSADGALARWGFSSEDLASTAALVDLRVEPVTADILAVSRGEPVRPSAIRRTAWRIIERLK
ncbi:SAM-dependent methyltransferase [Novosphingobium huizhouense]|uniref:SAM-dependent methyltransferase n=1 Tax=Novosphingobium huizhouense TaxID=2866625 RepID=UPI001CD8FAFB|nr:class I SAM-dependent methyltransferase [Novosphingobium huizhouense]